MGGPREYHAKQGKSDRRRKASYDFLHMSGIKQKATNEQTKQAKKPIRILSDTENSVLVA